MNLTKVKDIFRNLPLYEEKEIEIGGWIRTMRQSKNVSFMEVNDGTFFKNVHAVNGIVFCYNRTVNYLLADACAPISFVLNFLAVSGHLNSKTTKIKTKAADG